MATLKDLLASGMSRDEINAILSQSIISTDGFQGNPQPDYRDALDLGAISTGGGLPPQQQTMAQFFANPQPEQLVQQPEAPRFTVGDDGLSRMTDRPGVSDQSPMNSIRNNTTGVVTQMPTSRQGRSHDVWADGPEVLHRQLMPDGRTLVTERVPAMSDGRQSVGIRQRIETPDYLNPAMIQKQKYENGAAELAQMQMQSERLKNQKAQQEIAQGERMASASGMGIPKLEKGEMWNADAGRVDSVPGSSRFITQQGKFSADKRAFDAIAMKTQGAEDKINEILGPKGDTDPSEGFKSNFGGYNAYLTQYMPGESSDTRKKIDSLKSDLRAAGLEMMRSGGSIGAMTEREWPIVEQMMASISPVLSEPEAAFQLAKIKTKMQQIRNSAQEDFEGSWKNTQFGSSGQRGAAQATGVTVTTPDGKTLKFPSAGAADAFRKAAGL